jgi:aspartate racemase
MKTIGILGGISPQATMDLEMRLHQVSQRIIPQHGNSGYPPLVTYYHRRAPVLTKDGIMPLLPLQADPELLEAARWLGMKADVLLIAANGAHVLQEQIERASGRNVFSMIEATLEEVRRRGWKKVGVLGFPDPAAPIYTKPLERTGMVCELIDTELQSDLNTDIQALMEGRPDHGAAHRALEVLRARGVDGIIPGCTEIPLLLGDAMNAPDLVNPVQLLVEAAVRLTATGAEVLR